MRSCINYNTFHKLNVQLTQREVPKVIGADGGDLGSMGTVQLMLRIGTSKVTQDFIVCRELRRNIILGVDFAKRNCAGIQWTTNRTRVLSLNGIKAVEVEEDKLGIPVTASYHVKIPPRHNAVFEVNIHAETHGTTEIMGTFTRKASEYVSTRNCNSSRRELWEISIIGNHKPGSRKNLASG